MARGRKTGGRQKGTPNKLTASLKEAILAAFDEAGGKEYLLKVAAEQPQVFCQLLGKVLPQQIDMDIDHNYVARMPDMPKTSDEWQKQHAPTIQ